MGLLREFVRLLLTEEKWTVKPPKSMSDLTPVEVEAPSSREAAEEAIRQWSVGAIDPMIVDVVPATPVEKRMVDIFTNIFGQIRTIYPGSAISDLVVRNAGDHPLVEGDAFMEVELQMPRGESKKISFLAIKLVAKNDIEFEFITDEPVDPSTQYQWTGPEQITRTFYLHPGTPDQRIGDKVWDAFEAMMKEHEDQVQDLISKYGAGAYPGP